MTLPLKPADNLISEALEHSIGRENTPRVVVKIRHPGGSQTTYTHNLKERWIEIQNDTKVLLGEVGRSGFEILVEKKAVGRSIPIAYFTVQPKGPTGELVLPWAKKKTKPADKQTTPDLPVPETFDKSEIIYPLGGALAAAYVAGRMKQNPVLFAIVGAAAGYFYAAGFSGIKKVL